MTERLLSRISVLTKADSFKNQLLKRKKTKRNRATAVADGNSHLDNRGAGRPKLSAVTDLHRRGVRKVTAGSFSPTTVSAVDDGLSDESEKNLKSLTGGRLV